MHASVTGVSEQENSNQLSGIMPFLSADSTDAFDLYYTCSNYPVIDSTPVTRHASPR
jgi:hypothetical protein